MKLHKLPLSRIMAVFFSLTSITALAQSEVQPVSLSGNAYITQRADKARISDKGVDNWSSPETTVSAYFHVDKPQTITLSLEGSGHATMRMICNGKKQNVKFDSDELITAGTLKIKIRKPGHVRVDIKGVKREGETFANITNLMVAYADGKVTCVHNFSDYWGRRGPSVHMGYSLPKGSDYEWFYNEVTVPEDGETMHSYYMVAGFGQGYFGMQYNSETERRVLFSVWSPFDTQDPRNIPEDQRIRLLRVGNGVHIGEFGNEGSGGQSYMKYPWKTGTTYPFLMRVRPDEKGNTIYTAYFYATEAGEWRLVAEFLRPQTSTWYTNAHSFLENFNPEQGYLSRKVQYKNQWARTTDGRWVRPSNATFTNDATAHAGVRLDYIGGQTADGKALYLQMGGFFNENLQSGTRIPLPAYDSTQPPVIDWEALDKLGEAK